MREKIKRYFFREPCGTIKHLIEGVKVGWSMVERVYCHPKYYEIAFSFRDLANEVETLDCLREQYLSTSSRRVLEIGCGSAPHLPEFHRKGYEYVGLDISRDMLQFALERAEALGARAEFVCASLTDFQISQPVDMGVVFLGSLYVVDTEELQRHFDCMRRAVRPGGLYILDWCVDFVPATDLCETWTEEKDGIRVRTTYHAASIDRAKQTYRETVTLEVEDGRLCFMLQETGIKRAIYPQEFLFYLALRGDFEFLGWWNAWDLGQPLGPSSSCYRPVVAIRRT